ncbi:heat-inducible transcriptional repressor HrcA [Shouchella shacheensis]|uniref:heat-inducible transcriptional repressor HrcA n=1 Tax=Shouchella shacheensis TaxID=1649580 RepID=UPI00073FF55E|nr:heat-inducible transcriptional repressor HrcA [Shouchella shacheensis]
MLTERQLLILHAIVDDYVRTAEPVGSRSISKRDDIPFSPATIRNDMSDLEELGFLEKPHSSAGRAPSQQGYRYYVDHLLSPHRLTGAERAGISSLASARLQAMEEVIQESARILSEMTSYVSIVLGPEWLEAKLRNIQIVPMNDHKAIVIIVSETGHVENHLVHIDEAVTLSDLERTVNLLNERLVGTPLVHLQGRISAELVKLFKQHVANYKQVLKALNDSFNVTKADKVFYSGKTNLMIQPEFQDMNKIRSLFNMLEEESLMHQWLRSQNNGLHVSIGAENEIEAFESCSLVTATYAIDGRHVGTLGVIGPTRMEYRRMIKVVDSLSKDLSKLLTDLYQND